jgi:hypothetical protein
MDEHHSNRCSSVKAPGSARTDGQGLIDTDTHHSGKVYQSDQLGQSYAVFLNHRTVKRGRVRRRHARSRGLILHGKRTIAVLALAASGIAAMANTAAAQASPAGANTTQFISMTFAEPIAPTAASCPVAPEGFCGSGEVIPLGHATEMIHFGAGCGGSCDLRTVSLAGGSLVLDETFSNGSCPGACQPNPASPSSGTLTDVVAGGTAIYAGATGTLSGTVRAAGGIIGPRGTSIVKLAGTIHYGQ